MAEKSKDTVASKVKESKRVYCCADVTPKCRCWAKLNDQKICPRHEMLMNMEKGEVEYKCLECAQPVTSLEKALICETCDMWVHSRCFGMRDDVYDILYKEGSNLGDLRFDCKGCRVKVQECMEKFKGLQADTIELKDSMKDVKKEISNIKNTVKLTVKTAISTEMNKKQDIDKRKLNLVVFGLPEIVEDGDESKLSTLDGDAKKKIDMAAISDIITNELEIALSPRTGLCNAIRLGKKPEKVTDRPRPVKIEFKDIDVKRDVLTKAKNLRNSVSKIAQKLYINPDLSKEQIEFEKKLREKMWERRQKGENVIIRKGKLEIVPFEVRKTRYTTTSASGSNKKEL